MIPVQRPNTIIPNFNRNGMCYFFLTYSVTSLSMSLLLHSPMLSSSLFFSTSVCNWECGISNTLIYYFKKRRKTYLSSVWILSRVASITLFELYCVNEISWGSSSTLYLFPATFLPCKSRVLTVSLIYSIRF